MDYKDNLKKKTYIALSFFVLLLVIFTYLIITQINLSLLIEMIILSIFSFFLSLFFYDFIYNSISTFYNTKTDELEDGLNQLSHGNLSFRIDGINNKKENHLVNNFNEMATSLEISIKTIEKNERDLEIIIENRTKKLNETNLKLLETMEELKKTQINSLQTEKQKSLSAIVSGFAHEINNPLTGILGHLDLIDLKNDISDYAKDKHLSIRKQALRIRTIIKELNLLNPSSEQTKLNINLLNFFEKFIKVFNKKDIFINIEFKTTKIFIDPTITGNHFSLWMCFEGICENSLEAIKGNNIVNGEIIITLDESKDKKYAIISVCDNGGGFQNTEKVFDPFYTTKSRTQKKGIGLSIAYNMIREHDGTVEVSNNDKGGTVTIKLPLNPT